MTIRIIGSYTHPGPQGMTHGANPVYHKGHVYFASRDENNRSFIIRRPLTLDKGALGRFDIILGPGQPGSPDDDGCVPCQVTDDGMIIYLGWNVRKRVPFTNTLMQAKLHTDGYGTVGVNRRIVMQRDEIVRSISYGWIDDEGLYYGAVTGFDPLTCILMGPRPYTAFEVTGKPCICGDKLYLGAREQGWRNYDTYVLEKEGDTGWKMLGKIDKDDAGAMPYYAHVFEDMGKTFIVYNWCDDFGRRGFRLGVL